MGNRHGLCYRWPILQIQQHSCDKYQGSKYLSLPKKDTSIENNADTGEVCDNDLDFAKPFWCALYAKLHVKVETTAANLGMCTKCGIQLNIARCATLNNAKLLISSGTNYHTLNVFGTNINDIAEQKQIIVESLLSARPFSFTHENNVITGISRPAWVWNSSSLYILHFCMHLLHFWHTWIVEALVKQLKLKFSLAWSLNC